MADVTAHATASVADGISYYLDFLERRCFAFEESVATWDVLSSEEKNDVLSEWSIVEDRIEALRRLLARGSISPTEQRRYSELQGRLDRDRGNLASLWQKPAR